MRPFHCASLALFLGAVAMGQVPVEGVVERPDVRLHYKVYGDKGPYAIILSGGPGGATELLQPFAEHLKDRFRCVMLDQRGTGKSKLEAYDEKTVSFDAYIADIEAVRIALKQDRIILVGSSWGMTLAFAYAGAHQDRVQALAAIGSGHISTESERAWMERLRSRAPADRQQKLDELMDRDLPDEVTAIEYLKIILPSYFYKQEEAAKFAAALKPGDLNPHISLLSGAVFGRLDEYVLTKLERITCPVLLVQGRYDLAPEKTAHVISEKVRASKVVLLDKCGHMPWLDQPVATWQAVDEFFRPGR